MNKAYLLTGGNIGNRMAHLKAAAQQVQSDCGIILLQSSVYETAAWGKEDQAPFLNSVLCISTLLSAEALLAAILHIEEKLGRKRAERYGPRLIDIDILLYNHDVIDLPGLQVPHPQLPYRRFALAPLAEVAGDEVHPVLNKTITELLQACTDNLDVHKFEP